MVSWQYYRTHYTIPHLLIYLPDDTSLSPVEEVILEENPVEPDESLLLPHDQYDAERNDCDSDVEDCNDWRLTQLGLRIIILGAI